MTEARIDVARIERASSRHCHFCSDIATFFSLGHLEGVDEDGRQVNVDGEVYLCEEHYRQAIVEARNDC